MSSVLERYKRWFVDENQEDAERDADRLRDCQTFCSTQTYNDFVARIRAKSRETAWTPGMTQEEAATNLVAKTIFDGVLDELETLKRIATEHMRDG